MLSLSLMGIVSLFLDCMGLIEFLCHFRPSLFDVFLHLMTGNSKQTLQQEECSSTDFEISVT